MGGFGPSARTERVTVERATMTKNRVGQATETWAVMGKAWVSVRFGSGLERRAAAQEGTAQAATFGFADSELARGLRATDRIDYDGGRWDITAVAREPRRRGVTVTGVRAG